MFEYHSSESIGVMAMVYLMITILVAIRCLVLCKERVGAAWAGGFAEEHALARAAVGQSRESTPWMARAVAAWLSLLWNGALAAAVSALWPAVFMPIFAFAFFLPFYFKMAFGLLVLLGLWSLRGRLPWWKAI